MLTLHVDHLSQIAAGLMTLHDVGRRRSATTEPLKATAYAPDDAFQSETAELFWFSR
jgi:hypothetical protein